MSASASLGPSLALLCLALPVSIAGTNIALALLTVAMLFAAARGTELRWGQAADAAFWAVGLYCAAGLLASLAGVDPGRSLGMLPKDLHKLWSLAVLRLSFSRKPSPGAYRFLAAGFAVVALVGLFQAAQSAWSGGAIRAHAFVHPVTYGEQLAIGLLGALCFLRSEGRWASAFLALCGAALVLNQTRGALIGLAAGFAALCLADRRMRRWAVWAAAAALAVVLVWEFMPTGGRTLRGLAQSWRVWSEGGAMSPSLARWTLWDVALKEFKDHPWLGVGPGNYQTVFTSYFSGTIESQRAWGSAHNLYLHQLAERGLLGFLALAAVLWTLTARAWRRARENPNPWNLWALGTMAAFLVMNLTETAFQNEQVTTLVLFVWASSEANARGAAGRI